MNLKELVKKDESETLEFKKSLSEWKEIIETISAFSNTKGGTIVVGIDNKGKVHGVAMGKNTIEDLTNKILTNTEPKIYPAITLLSGENKNVIVIRVEKFPYDVVLAFGRPFKRVGRSTVKMSNDEYKKRILDDKIKIMSKKLWKVINRKKRKTQPVVVTRISDFMVQRGISVLSRMSRTALTGSRPSPESLILCVTT